MAPLPSLVMLPVVSFRKRALPDLSRGKVRGCCASRERQLTATGSVFYILI